MRLVTYRQDGANRAGVVSGERVIDLARGGAALGIELPADIVGLLELGVEGLARVGQLLAQAGDPPPGVALADADLGPVIPRPPTIFLLAGNYQSHLTEGGGARVDKAKITPRFFIKPRTSLIGTGEAITIPTISDKIDYELEIAAVIGKRGKAIPLAEAASYVAGYAVFNDISARELKYAAARTARPMDDFFDWLTGKWCDSFAALGPFLVTRDEIGDPKALEMALRVNGELRQHSAAGEMIFDVPESIAFISQFVTLEPGDLFCMGTPGGVGVTTQTFLRPGDLVEAEIEKLGRLSNPVQ
jgi:2-keto-4-pentenoate hydratase/2-oxohepta-3-ene-1,7-dioic acid hydratase in catechol pathway